MVDLMIDPEERNELEAIVGEIDKLVDANRGEYLDIIRLSPNIRSKQVVGLIHYLMLQFNNTND